MLSPQVSRQLKQLIEFYQRGVFVEKEFSLRLASLVSRENAVDMLQGLPPEAVPWLKEAVVAAAQDAVDADCLCPEESVFQERTVSAAYYLRVAEALLERSAAHPRPKVTVVCLPSFEVEWALRVRGSSKIGFTATLTEPEEKIWCHADPRSVQVRAKQRTLDTSLGEAICEVWKNGLLRTRHPRRARLGLDGVSYHFAYSGVGHALLFFLCEESGRGWGTGIRGKKPCTPPMVHPSGGLLSSETETMNGKVGTSPDVVAPADRSRTRQLRFLDKRRMAATGAKG